MVTLDPWEVFHVQGLSFHNDYAIDLVAKARDEIALNLAKTNFTSRFFAQGNQQGGILMLPPAMKREARDRLAQQVANKSRPENWFKTMLLRDGAKWQSTSVDPRSAQMAEIDTVSAKAVAGFFNLPAWKLNISDSDSYNSGENAQLDYITGSLKHRFRAIQGEAGLKLLTPTQKQGRKSQQRYFKHNYAELLETDQASKVQLLMDLRQNEIIHANDVLSELGKPLRDDELAEKYYNPNTRDSNETPGEPEPEAIEPEQEQPEPEQDDLAIAALVRQSCSRAAKRICTPYRNKSRRPNGFLEFVDAGGDRNKMRAVFRGELEPTFRVASANPELLLDALETRFFGQLNDKMAELLEPPHSTADLESNVSTFCDEFESQFIAEILTNTLKIEDKRVKSDE